MKEPTVRSFLGKSVSYHPLGTCIMTDDKNIMILDVRGWGEIQHLFDTNAKSEYFQDQIGEFVTQAINEKLINDKIRKK